MASIPKMPKRLFLAPYTGLSVTGIGLFEIRISHLGLAESIHTRYGVRVY
jgi:hypothetical protein